MEKMNRSQFATYLDTTPKSEATYKILGIGITDYAISFNPSVETEKWIIEDTARHVHESNEKQGSVTQSIYIDDPCYQFVKAGIDKLNYRTNILDIDMSVKNEDGTYPAKLSEGIVAITSYMGENATIEYDLYYDGDSKDGKVDMTTGTPIFTAIENEII